MNKMYMTTTFRRVLRVRTERTPWTGRAWRRQAQIHFPELPLREGMQRIARILAIQSKDWPPEMAAFWAARAA